MNRFRLAPFWQALLILAAVYLGFTLLLLPSSLMTPFMVICAVGLLLYYSFDDARWAEFKSPLRALMRDDGKAAMRWAFLLALPLLAGYQAYRFVAPATEAPAELRQMHPAPPGFLSAYGERYDLERLENPLRREVLERLEKNPEAGWGRYGEIVAAGRDLYYQNCLFCHGALLDGQGHYSQGLDPRPVSFQDPTILPQLQESYLFWRIVTGGPGLPREGAPWNSAMPAWEEMLSAEQVWQIITFIFDYTGQTPRIWDPDLSQAVASMQAQAKAGRADLQGQELYRFRCQVCHGEQGMGDGPAAQFMDPRPRDFSLSLYKYKSSPGTLPPRDEDLFDSIKWGLPGSAMPGWESLLSDEQIRSLVPVLKGFDIAGIWAPEDADEAAFDEEGRYTGKDFIRIATQEPLDGQVPYSEVSQARGREVYEKNCRECHGEAGRGNILSGKKLADDWGQRIWPRDLTRPSSWRSQRVVEGRQPGRDEVIQAIYNLISHGIPGTPMPAHRAMEAENPDPVSREDRWHTANYVYSLRDSSAPTVKGKVIHAARVAGELPVGADDPQWQRVEAVSLPLVPNLIREERLFTPLNDALSLRSLFNDDGIVFLLEVHDRTESRPGIAYFSELQDAARTMQADALAIQLPKFPLQAQAKPHFAHGDRNQPVNIWYWNAGRVKPEQAASANRFEAGGAELKKQPQGERVSASSEWWEGRWRVVMRVSRSETGSLPEGRFIPVAFANWDGSNGEVGSKHSLSSWYWLFLPGRPEPWKSYGIPLGVGLLTLLAGLLLVRSQRLRP
jgi:DMSO reductase family type II enzyme heme b subunit